MKRTESDGYMHLPILTQLREQNEQLQAEGVVRKHIVSFFILSLFFALPARATIRTFPPGVTTRTGPISLQSDTIYRCEPGAMLRLADNANTPLFRGRNVARILLDGCELDGNSMNQTPVTGRHSTLAAVDLEHVSDITIRNVTIRDYPYKAIHVMHSQGLTIETPQIADTPVGIYFRRVTGAMISQARITNYRVAGIVVEDHNENVTVQDGYLETAVRGGDGASDCISGYGSQNRSIRYVRNTCVGAPNHGVHVAGTDLVITDNTISDPVLVGIFVANQDGSTNAGLVLERNTVSRSGWAGMYVHTYVGATIRQNSVFSARLYGMLLTFLENVQLIANQTSNTVGNGLHLDSVKNGMLALNRNQGMTGQGIVLQNVSGVVQVGNR